MMQQKTSFKYKALLKKYKEAETLCKTIEDVDKIAKLCLDNTEAKIELDVYLRVYFENKSPKELREKELKNIDNPEEFLNTLNNMENGLFKNPKKDEIHEVNLKNLDNSTFLMLSEKILDSYKKQLKNLDLL
jgi:Asp-tRNA(Asn)/Glu-tRNA(Gln) amidotransferase C subunit